MTLNHLKALALGLTFAILGCAYGQAPGDLVITPTRVLLDDHGRSGDITIVNRGSETIRYRLSLVDMEMSEDGELRRVPSTANSGTDVLRMSPREIVLEPGVSQRIKIAAFFPNGAPSEEVRSHLAFEPIALPAPAHRETSGDSTSLKLKFEVRSVVTIPVIAQHGELTAAASIENAAISKDREGWFARFRLDRAGSRSIRGDALVEFVPAGSTHKIEIGRMTNLPVYYPNPDRIVTVRLNQDVRSLGKGEIVISFAETQRSRGAATAKTAVEPPG